MKKIVGIIELILIIILALMLSSCKGDDIPIYPLTEVSTQTPSVTPMESTNQTQNNTLTVSTVETTSQETAVSNDSELFEGKIAIITSSSNTTQWFSAMPVIAKYGEDKVIHVECPLEYIMEQEKMVSLVLSLGADPDIKAIIVNRAYIGVNVAFSELRKIRKDIFVVFCEPDTDRSSKDSLQTPSSIARAADLILDRDELGMGPAMAKQALKLGAETFVHYSLPRNMSMPLLSELRNLISTECEKLGIVFIDAAAIDPLGEAGRDSATEFIYHDVPEQTKQHGKNTAFFAPDFGLQIPLLTAIVSEGAIFPQPYYPSPYSAFSHVFPLENELSKKHYDPSFSVLEVTREAINSIHKAIADKNMLGRLSTWPVEDEHMYTMMAVEYAIKWISGDVSREGIDVDVLKQLMADYAGVEVFLTPYTDQYPYTEFGTGETYDNYLMMRMDYIIFD